MTKKELYTHLISKCSDFELKGKNMLYTSANGHMFSQLNKAGELGIRFSKKVQEKYIQEFDTDYFRSYGAVMKGYVLIPEDIWNDLDNLAELMTESYKYVMSLDAK